MTYENPVNMSDKELIRFVSEEPKGTPEFEAVAAEIKARDIWIEWRGKAVMAWGHG
jgi:hypothetical protein